MQKKIELKDGQHGFSERDLYSKAILNTDAEMLLKYKIQKNRQMNIMSSVSEIDKMKTEMQAIRNELSDIKQILIQLSAGKTWQ